MISGDSMETPTAICRPRGLWRSRLAGGELMIYGGPLTESFHLRLPPQCLRLPRPQGVACGRCCTSCRRLSRRHHVVQALCGLLRRPHVMFKGPSPTWDLHRTMRSRACSGAHERACACACGPDPGRLRRRWGRRRPCRRRGSARLRECCVGRAGGAALARASWSQQRSDPVESIRPGSGDRVDCGATSGFPGFPAHRPGATAVGHSRFELAGRLVVAHGAFRARRGLWRTAQPVASRSLVLREMLPGRPGAGRGG